LVGKKEVKSAPKLNFHPHPHYAASTLAPHEQGEGGRTACVSHARSPSFDGPKSAPFVLFLGHSRTTASSRPREPDRQVLEERASLFSHAHKDNGPSFSSYPLGLIATRSVPFLCASYMEKRKVTAEELLARAESDGYKRGPTRERQHLR
jgi:hypothetical protein